MPSLLSLLQALLGCLVSRPLAPGAQASPWPAASLQLIANKESRVAQPGFSRRYLVGHDEREPEPQGRDYKALPTNAAGNNTCDSISSAGNEHEYQPSLHSSRLQGYLSKKATRYPEEKILLLLPVCLMQVSCYIYRCLGLQKHKITTKNCKSTNTSTQCK